MVTRSLFRGLAVTLVGACTACTAIPLDYLEQQDGGSSQDVGNPDTLVESGGDAIVRDAVPQDTGVTMPESGRDAGSGPPCPCDTATTGQYCCIPSGTEAPFCTSDGTSCISANGIFVFCQSSDPTTESVCCWNGGVGPGAAALYATTCGTRPAACAQASDCSGGTCQTTVCAGVTIGACGAQPSCP
jgi:hypothetical protein